ncbi:caspase family protein [Patescibacteria group bacterium]|nr:caspase family protein [Patescibacteria group bacterium]
MDAIIIPSVANIQYKEIDTTGFDFWTSSRVDAQITVKVVMTDLKNSPIVEKTIKSPRIIGKKIRTLDYGKPEHLSEIGRISFEGVSAALQEAAREMVMSGDVIHYASVRSKTKAMATKPSQEASPIITSDIDELPTIKVRQNKNAYAIVIGIEQYRQKLPKADFAVSDAKLVSEYLFKVMGYPEQNIVTLTNEHASKGDFEKYFEKWLFNNVEKDGTVFIYYSGHGAPNPKTSDAYLVPYDGDPTFIDQTGYSLKRMYDVLGKLPAKEIIVTLDSCFSGAGGRSVLAKGARPLVMDLQSGVVLPKNMTVLSASSGDQISSTYDEKGHGLFTYFMLKGIKNEDVVNPDGSIKMDDLFGYLKPQVERIARKQYNNEQTPQLIGAKKN